jgi:hypothetical protein
LGRPGNSGIGRACGPDMAGPAMLRAGDDRQVQGGEVVLGVEL